VGKPLEKLPKRMNERFLDLFSEISLNNMEATRLMNRVDTKYIFRRENLPEILNKIQPYYHVLQLQSKRVFRYDTLYFDTPERLFYNQHLCGKLNRYKIRTRHYVETNTHYFEVKWKNNKRRTIKKRVELEDISEEICPKSRLLLHQTMTDIPLDLEPTVWVYYHRFTLVNKQTPERLTFDLNLWFRWQNHSAAYPHLIVAEAKQPKLFQSPFISLMKEIGVREGGLSKYCLGLLNLEPNIKSNLFKPMLARINQLNDYRKN
jgi:hypothetical protein